MVLDRAYTDAQLAGDLSAGLVLSQQDQNAALGRRQIINSRLLPGKSCSSTAAIEQVRRKRRADVILACGNGSDTVDDISRRVVLDQIAPHAEIECFIKVH